MYNNIDLSTYKMNEKEFEKASQIIKKIKELIFDDEVNTFGLFDLRIGYIEKGGYYVLLADNNGDYNLVDGFPTISESVATMNIIYIASCNQGFEYEHNYREYLKEMWNEDYPNLMYDGRKYAYEYSLKKIKNIAKYVSSNYIDNFLEKLNAKQNIWKYDSKNNCFIEVN